MPDRTSTETRLQGWPDYPLQLNGVEMGVEDLLSYHEDLENSASNLFLESSDHIEVEVVNSGQNYENNEAQIVTNLQQLENVLLANLEYHSAYFSISQLNSWSRLRITKDMFYMMCHFHNIFPKFVDIVMAFGKARVVSDDYFMGCYGHIGSGEQGTFEICYNLRHFEIHGRELEDPWSCRQTAIYHQLYFEDARSVWIITQRPKLLRTNSNAPNLTNMVPHFSSIGHPLALHVRYISACVRNWKGYLRYMTERLERLDRRVCMPKLYKEYEIDLSISQDLQTIRRKLNNAITIQEATLDTIETLLRYSAMVEKRMQFDGGLHQFFGNSLHDISNEIRGYIRITRKLFSFSDDIRLLSHKILSLLNSELSYENGLTLKQVALSGSKDGKLVLQMARKTWKDSRTMRIATTIALLYLPANLVMSFFSTTLVGYDANTRHLVIRVELWIATVATVVLALLTVGAAIFWDKGGHRALFTKV